MKKIIILSSLLFASICSLFAQDIGIDVQPFENGVQNSTWAIAPGNTHQIVVTIFNNGSGDLPAYRIRPFVSIGPGVSFDAVQPNLPAGWNLILNAPGQANELPGQSIRFGNGTDVILEAESREFRINVTVTANGTYTPTATVAWANGVASGATPGPQPINNLTGNDNSTFPFSVTGVLPLKLVSFTAAETDCQTTLNWLTENEVGTSHFVVEYSDNGTVFNPIANVTAQGYGNGKNYSYKVLASNPVSYYRLKMVDADGRFMQSNVLVVRSACGNTDFFTVYPNPVVGNNIVTVNYKVSNYKGPAYIILLNANGQRVAVNNVTVQAARVNVEKINMANYAAGIYYVQLTDSKGNILKNQKITKQ